MTTFHFIPLLLLWVSTLTQTNYFPNYYDTTIQTQTSKDTLYLYFPLKQAGQSFDENANSLDTSINVWYSKTLTAMKEPVLANYEGDTEIYRFTWLRTFNNPIAIRIQRTKDSIILIAKKLSGAGGYDPGQLITDTTLTLSLKNWDEVQAKIKQINFWILSIETDFRGNDGAEWILEGSTEGFYHFTTRWSEGKGSAYGNLCLYLLNLSGIKVPDNQIY